MGSTGVGRFGDYDAAHDYSSPAGAQASNLNALNAELKSVAIEKVIRLEDVSTSDYYMTRNSLPLHGEEVYIDTKLFDKRMVVRDKATSTIIGNLPTIYQKEYLDALAGVVHDGIVWSVTLNPFPAISIKIDG